MEMKDILNRMLNHEEYPTRQRCIFHKLNIHLISVAKN